MGDPIEIPVKGRPMTATWGASVAKRLNAIGSVGSARMLLFDGDTGTGFEPLPENLRARVRHRPFEVAGSGGDDYKFAIYVPANVVAIGEDIVVPDGITAIPDTDGWYKLDDESEVSEYGSTLYLVAYDDRSATFTFDLEEAAGGESEEDPEILAILPIAELKTQSVGQKTFGVVYRQLACHPFAVSLGGTANPDGASIDIDKDGKIEFFHFKDNQQDSGKGLAQRLKADPETGAITSDDSTGAMLVARKDGKVIYIPLDGEGEDPETPQTPGGEQCDHDKTGGKEGGVAPTKEKEPGGSAPAGGGVPAGGVPAGGGDRHTGDDGCNCN